MENKNYLWLRGQTTYTDKDFIEKFNLDPSLEGKPEINDKMLDVVFELNKANYMDYHNMPEDEAAEKANDARTNVAKDIARALKKK